MISTLKTLLVANSFLLALGASVLPIRAENSTCQFNVNLDTADIANTTYLRMVKNVKLPRSGRTYRYVINPPFEQEKPYILFLHGFPESSYSWVHQIEYFTRNGYGIIAPDLLGAGGTDKPAELEAYSLKAMAAEVTELLDCEGLDKVVAVGHDLGSLLLSRLHTYHSDYFSALAFFDIGYIAPGVDLNRTYVDSFNNLTQAGFGHPIFGYWYFFNQPDAHLLMDARFDSFDSLGYTTNSTAQREEFVRTGRLQEWLEADKRAQWGNEYNTNSTREQRKTIIQAQGGLEAALKWYRAFVNGINSADEKENESRSGMVQMPLLFVAADHDQVGVPSTQLSTTLPYAPTMRIRTVDAGHFVHLEKPQEVNKHFHDFLQSL